MPSPLGLVILPNLIIFSSLSILCLTGEAATFTLNLANKARQRALGPLHPQFNIVNHLKSALEVFLPDNAHIVCSGRLFVSLTRVNDRQNVLMSEFHSKEDLIEVMQHLEHQRVGENLPALNGTIWYCPVV